MLKFNNYLKNEGPILSGGLANPCLLLWSRGFASLDGTFGSEIFHGPREYDPRSRLKKLPREGGQYPPSRLYFLKYRPEISQGVGKLLFKASTELPRSFFNVDLPESPMCVVGSPDPDAVRAKDITTELRSRTRGYAIQLTITGKGCRAFFEPEWPHLKYKGRGRVIDFTNSCIRVADKVRVHVSKTGFVITVHGYDIVKVRSLAAIIQNQGKCHLYSMSGITYSQIPVVQLKRAKK